MANEGSLSVSMAWSNGTRSASANASFNFDVTETVCAQGTINISTSAEQLSVGDVATPRYAFFRNHDATNYVEIGDWNGASPIYVVKLKAGDFCVLPLTLASTDIALKANTGACDVSYLVLGT